MALLTPSERRRLARAHSALVDCTAPTWPIDAIAAEAAMSRFHFIRRFRSVFGDTPSAVRMRARMERARFLLAHREATVTEVCLELGYASLGSFSTLYSRHHGESPLACRRRLWSLAAGPAETTAALQPSCLGLLLAAWRRAPEQFSRSRTTASLAHCGELSGDGIPTCEFD